VSCNNFAALKSTLWSAVNLESSLKTSLAGHVKIALVITAVDFDQFSYYSTCTCRFSDDHDFSVECSKKRILLTKRINAVCLCYLKTGKYKVEIFDRQQNRYIQSVSGLGMHVDVRDPEDKTVLSRVSVTFSVWVTYDAGKQRHYFCI